MSSDPTKVFSLRPMGVEDVDHIAAWFTDFDDVAMFDRSVPVPVGIEYMRQSWTSALEFSAPPRALWFVAVDGNGKPGGICGLDSINYINGDSTVPIFIAKDMRGKGLALAMSVNIIHIAFETLRLHRLTTFYREDNTATGVITSRMGFKEEGRLREAWFSEGRHKDVIQVGLLKSDWLKIRDNLTSEIERGAGISITIRHVSQ